MTPEEATKAATLRRYIGNPDTMAEMYVKDGQVAYRPFEVGDLDSVLEEHVTGVRTVGSYVLHFDKARFLCFDLDNGDQAEARRLLAACKRMGLNAALEVSGGKGYHVWVVFDILEPGDQVKRLAEYIAAEVGFTGEVFPKQAVATKTGNLVKLPYGKHQKTGNWSRFIGPPPLPALNSHARFEKAVEKLPAVQTKQVTSVPSGLGTYPCMESFQTDPPGEGERNNCLYHYAFMLRRGGLVDPFVETALRDLNEAMSEPFPDWKIDELVRQSMNNRPGCNSVPPERHCGDLCITRRYTTQTLWPGKLRQAPEGSQVLLEVGERDGDVVELRHPDIAQARARLTNGDGS